MENKQMKICSSCKQEKNIKEFGKNLSSKDGFCHQCKDCRKIYYLENKDNIKRYKKQYYLENKENLNQCAKQYYLENKENRPWKLVLQNIKTRCTNVNAENYKNYGGRGIKCLISAEELKQLWFRDKAYNMKKPTIDRIDNDGNYIYENCQFIEMSENVAKDSKKPILQYDLQGNFIKEWESITEASKKLNLNRSNISQCLRGKNKTISNFIWKYKK